MFTSYRFIILYVAFSTKTSNWCWNFTFFKSRDIISKDIFERFLFTRSYIFITWGSCCRCSSNKGQKKDPKTDYTSHHFPVENQKTRGRWRRRCYKQNTLALVVATREALQACARTQTDKRHTQEHILVD